VLIPFDAHEIISDFSDNEAGDEDSGTSVTVTAATCVLCLNSEHQQIDLVPCGHIVMCSQSAYTVFDNGEHVLPNAPSFIPQLLTSFSTVLCTIYVLQRHDFMENIIIIDELTSVKI
jgi:hypothetical protein